MLFIPIDNSICLGFQPNPKHYQTSQYEVLKPIVSKRSFFLVGIADKYLIVASAIFSASLI